MSWMHSTYPSDWLSNGSLPSLLYLFGSGGVSIGMVCTLCQDGGFPICPCFPVMYSLHTMLFTLPSPYIIWLGSMGLLSNRSCQCVRQESAPRYPTPGCHVQHLILCACPHCPILFYPQYARTWRVYVGKPDVVHVLRFAPKRSATASLELRWIWPHGSNMLPWQ